MCRALGLPVAADHITHGRYGHASRNLLAAARRAGDRNRAAVCRSLRSGVQMFDSASNADWDRLTAIALAASMLAGVIVDPLVSAACNRFEGVDSSCWTEFAAILDMNEALTAWRSMPDPLRPVAMKLVEEMSWRRAFETAYLLADDYT